MEKNMFKPLLGAFLVLGWALVFLAGCSSPSSSAGTQGIPGPSVYLVDLTNGNAKLGPGAVDHLPSIHGSGSGSAPTTPYAFRLVNATGAALTVGTAATTGGLRVQYSAGGSTYATDLGTSGLSDLSLSGLAAGSLAAGQSSNFTVTLQDLGYCYQNACLETRRRFVIPLTDASTSPPTSYDFVFEVYGVIVC